MERYGELRNKRRIPDADRATWSQREVLQSGDSSPPYELHNSLQATTEGERSLPGLENEHAPSLAKLLYATAFTTPSKLIESALLNKPERYKEFVFHPAAPAYFRPAQPYVEEFAETAALPELVIVRWLDETSRDLAAHLEPDLRHEALRLVGVSPVLGQRYALLGDAAERIAVRGLGAQLVDHHRLAFAAGPQGMIPWLPRSAAAVMYNEALRRRFEITLGP